MIENNEKLSVIEDYIYLINHIHISEPHLGVIKKRPIHKQLFSIDYNNYISVEMKESSITDVERVISYVSNLLI